MKSRWNLPGTGTLILAAAAIQWDPQKVTFEYLKDSSISTEKLNYKTSPWTRDWNAGTTLPDIAYLLLEFLIIF